jgi:hypothetical protein
MESAIEDEYVQIRRAQRNYDARRRRLVNARPQLRNDRDEACAARRELRCIESTIQTQWSSETQQLWASSRFAVLKKQRSLLLRRIRRRERNINRVAQVALGDRPEVDVDYDIETSILRALSRIGNRRQ